MFDAQMKRGLIEKCVLSLLCRGDSYGYQIIKDLSCYVEISESTLYPILRRLEADECLIEYSVEFSGRLRKFYRITEKGRRVLTEFAADWPQMVKINDFIQEGLSYEQK